MTDNIKLPPLPPLRIVPSVEPVDYPEVAQALMDYAREAVRLNVSQAESADQVQSLREALAALITWIPSADTYRRLGFDPEEPMRALGEARAALKQEACRG